MQKRMLCHKFKTWRQLSWMDFGMSMTLSTTLSCRPASMKLHENTCHSNFHLILCEDMQHRLLLLS